MADRYTSRIALVLDGPVGDLRAVVSAAVEAGDIDRATPVRDEGDRAQEVYWGGRMQKAVVRTLDADRTGEHLLRTETYLGSEGPTAGLRRQAQLVAALARALGGRVRQVRDLSALVDHGLDWIDRLVAGGATRGDAVVAVVDGEGTRWVRTHGAARFDVPDLELYGLHAGQVEAAIAAVAHVHDQLLGRGLGASLELPDGTPVYLVPVLEAWQQVPLDWPGVGRAGQVRGEGLDGPRASLSVLHPPRFGRYRKDLAGVLRALDAAR